MKKWIAKVIKKIKSKDPVVPVVRLDGVIAGSSRYQEALNLKTVGAELTKAFEMEKAKAVALIINSPGGSPTHSALVHDRIRHLAQKHDKKVLVFIEEVAASGGYWIACAGDEVFALPTSIVGSIGVISASFGFEEAIEKLGVKRRMHTSGDKKSFLDPFVPEKKEDITRLKSLQVALHDQFKAHVLARRGDKVSAEDTDVFSGNFWLGEPAKELGLVDSMGEIRMILEDRYGKDVKLPQLEKSKSWIRDMLGMHGPKLGASAWTQAVEYRAALSTSLSRFGL